MGYKTKDQFASKIPPPLDFSENPQFCDGKNGTRNERGEEFGEFEKPKKIASTIEKSWKNEKFGGSEKVKVKHKPMVSSNFRPALQGTDFINDDDIKIYYQNVNSAINIKPCFDLKETEIFKSFSKSPSAPECRRFLDSTLVRNLSDKEINKIRPIQAAMMTAVFTYPRQNPDTSKADILATSKTGSGKTLAFLIPLLQKAIERRDIQPNKNQRIPMALIFNF
uniref:ATP-dependent RNA helicase n=1 Tax=Panagrolaimus superbus TaxID=310955 RepID=A0A914Y8U9_9BILA